MFERTQIERAVDLQQRSYKLLRWMTDAIERGFISFDAAHTFSTLPDAAFAWLDRHQESIPVAARPPREDLRAFASLFASYLETSFELVEEPGTRLASHCGCTCPMCAWQVAMPRLRPKQLARAHKQRARALTASALRQLALELELGLGGELEVTGTRDDVWVDRLVDDAVLREPLALVAYGHDLLRRLLGVVEGPSTLALWRRFAWTPEGSPKRGFVLAADAILDGEATVVARLSAGAGATRA